MIERKPTITRGIEHKKKVGGGTLPPFHIGRELIAESNLVVVVLEVRCTDMARPVIEDRS
jgi:hypothetical protein